MHRIIFAGIEFYVSNDAEWYKKILNGHGYHVKAQKMLNNAKIIPNNAYQC